MSGASGAEVPADAAHERASDSPPRPQYGEYASPEEQRARIRQPEATTALEQGSAPPEGRPAKAPKPVATAGGTSAGRGAFIDRIATIALLAYGLINTFSTAPGLFEFEESATRAMETFGIDGGFTNFAAGRLWGAIAAIVLIIGWGVTAFLSWRRLRKGKITFWVPLVGGLVIGLLVTVCISIPLAGDPTFIDYVNRAAGVG